MVVIFTGRSLILETRCIFMPVVSKFGDVILIVC